MLKLQTHIRQGLATALLMLLIPCGASPQSSFTGCPGCWRNQSVMNGHGAASSTDPRRVINVRIDGSWGSQTPQNVWNGVCAGSQGSGCSNVPGPSAISMWDAVPTYYYLQLTQDQNQPNGTTDIRISRDSSWTHGTACASTALSGPYVPDPQEAGHQLKQVNDITIHLPPGSENWSQSQLACVIGHEMGHAMGLVDVYGGCSASVMNQNQNQGNGCATGCDRTQVSNIDVVSVNQQAGNRLGCNRNFVPATQHIEPGGGFQDPTPYRYAPTCYYYYDAIDLYYCGYVSIYDGSCHPDTPPEYIGTIYVLTDVICF